MQRIEAWYERLEDHWVLETLPETLLSRGPLGLLLWQWLALPLLLVLSALGGVALSVVMRPVLRKLLHKHELWVAMIERQRGPLWLMFGALFATMLVPLLYLTPVVAQPVRALTHIAIEVSLCWIAWRVADVLTTRARLVEWLESRPGLRGVLPLVRQLIGIALIAIAAAIALSEMGLSDVYKRQIQGLLAPTVFRFSEGGLSLIEDRGLTKTFRETSPETVRARSLRAEAERLLDQGEVRRAAELYQRAFLSASYDIDLGLAAAEAQVRSGQPDRALEMVTRDVYKRQPLAR